MDDYQSDTDDTGMFIQTPQMNNHLRDVKIHHRNGPPGPARFSVDEENAKKLAVETDPRNEDQSGTSSSYSFSTAL